jgi:hypothetical protein
VENERKLFLLLKKLVNAEIFFLIVLCNISTFGKRMTFNLLGLIGGSKKQTFVEFLEKKH